MAMQYYPQTAYAYSESPAPAMAAGNVNLRHYWHVILERRWLVIAAFVSVFVLCLVYLYKAPRVFEANTRIQIDREADTALNLRDVLVNVGSMDQDYLQTQYKNLLSRTLIESVIKKEKLAEDGRYAKSVDIAAEVAGDISVNPIRMSRLVDVKVQHTSPQKAKDIANTLANEFIEQNALQKQKKTLDMLFFLQNQASGLERDVQKAEEALQSYRVRSKFASLERDQNVIAEALSQAQARYAEAKSRAQVAQSTVDQLDRHVQGGKPVEIFPPIAVDGQLKNLQNQLGTLESDMAALRQRYLRRHPTMIQMQAKLDDTKKALAEAAQKVVATLRSEAVLAKSNEDIHAQLVTDWIERQTEWNKAKMDYDVLARKAESSKALFNLVLGKMKEVELVQKDKANNIRVIDQATAPLKPVKPRIVLTLMLGVFGGLAIAIGLAFFVNYLDDSIKSQDDVETYLRLPFLGYIPNIKSNSVVERDLQAHLHPQSNAAESFRTIRAAIALGSKANKVRVMTVTSTIPGEGKSLVASNLSIVMAQTGLRTLLIDADLRRPSVHKAFQLHSPVGLAAFLTEKANVVDELVHTTEVPNLDVVCVGATPSQPSELIGSKRMIHFLQEVSKRYDRVVMDCPPVSAVSDPLILSAMADGVVFVTKFNKIRREHARKTVQRIQDAGIHLCGVILNDIDFEGRDSYYYSYYYYQNRYYSSHYRGRQDAKEAKEAKATAEAKAKAAKTAPAAEPAAAATDKKA
ncbi:MAG: polysaccharide biosynthesis tyrosine autokinase [Verrucomicrobia bacterium]|nr:polysaccharide biosynthesis tyrosine autokinase [Verrucomicrobiota bacterium]